MIEDHHQVGFGVLRRALDVLDHDTSIQRSGCTTKVTGPRLHHLSASVRQCQCSSQGPLCQWSWSRYSPSYQWSSWQRPPSQLLPHPGSQNCPGHQ
jgi:hypothetical protein